MSIVITRITFLAYRMLFANHVLLALSVYQDRTALNEGSDLGSRMSDKMFFGKNNLEN